MDATVQDKMEGFSLKYSQSLICRNWHHHVHAVYYRTQWKAEGSV